MTNPQHENKNKGFAMLTILISLVGPFYIHKIRNCILPVIYESSVGILFSFPPVMVYHNKNILPLSTFRYPLLSKSEFSAQV